MKSTKPCATSNCYSQFLRYTAEHSGLVKLYAIREGLKAVEMKGIYPSSLDVDLLPHGIGNLHRWTPNFSSKYLETISKCFSQNQSQIFRFISFDRAHLADPEALTATRQIPSPLLVSLPIPAHQTTSPLPSRPRSQSRAWHRACFPMFRSAATRSGLAGVRLLSSASQTPMGAPAPPGSAPPPPPPPTPGILRRATPLLLTAGTGFFIYKIVSDNGVSPLAFPRAHRACNSIPCTECIARGETIFRSPILAASLPH